MRISVKPYAQGCAWGFVTFAYNAIRPIRWRLRSVKQNQIEGYFERIKNLVITLAENRMVVDATIEFSQAFEELPHELGITEQQLSEYRRELVQYYEQ